MGSYPAPLLRVLVPRKQVDFRQYSWRCHLLELADRYRSLRVAVYGPKPATVHWRVRDAALLVYIQAV